MVLIEKDVSPVDENKIFKSKGIGQIVLGECKTQLQASSSTNYLCFCESSGHLFVAVNEYLIICSLNDMIEAVEKVNLNKNEKVKKLKKIVHQFSCYIHAIFINTQFVGVYAIKNISGETINTFSTYNIELLLSSSIMNVNDALTDSVVMFDGDLSSSTTKLLCLESLEHSHESPYFRLVAIFQSHPPLEIFYDVSSTKYVVKKLLPDTNIVAMNIDVFNKRVYIGTDNGQLKVANSLKELNNIIRVQSIPSTISEQPLQVLSIQCINNGTIIVHYMGSEHGQRSPYSVIYTDNFKNAHICQNLFFFDDEAAEKVLPFLRATVFDSQLSVLMAYMSLSPDAEVIFRNPNDANQVSVLLDEDEKFTCPVTEDFTQANIIGVCSISIDFVPFVGGAHKKLSDLVILLSSDGAMILSCIDWLVPIDLALKKVVYLSQCKPIESNMLLPLYKVDEPMEKSTVDAIATNTKASDNFNVKELSTLLSLDDAAVVDNQTPDNLLSTSDVPLPTPTPNLIDIKPTDFSPNYPTLKSITLEPLKKPDFVVFSSNKNHVNLLNIVELLQPLEIFQLLINEFEHLKIRHMKSTLKPIDDMLEELRNQIDKTLDICSSDMDATTNDVRTYLKYKGCLEFLTKLSATCKARMSLITMDEFSNYNTFHSYNTEILDKIIETEQKLQALLPRIKTTYEKLQPKPKNIVCAMNKLEAHTIHHLHNMIDKHTSKRKMLTDRITQLALKTNQFVDLNIDNIYKTHIKNKVEKCLSKFTSFHCDTSHKKQFFDSIESFYKGNKVHRPLISKPSTDITNKSTMKENYCASTPQSDRMTSALLDIENSDHFFYDIDPTTYSIDMKNLKPSLSPFNASNYFDHHEQYSDIDLYANNTLLTNKTVNFNVTSKSAINNEWNNFIAEITQLNSSKKLSTDSFGAYLASISSVDFAVGDDPISDFNVSDKSIFNIYNESAMKLIPTATKAKNNFESVEAIQNTLNDIFYKKQLRSYCDQHNIIYNEDSIDFCSEEEHLVHVFKLLGLSCENYLSKVVCESTNYNSSNVKKTGESATAVPLSNDAQKVGDNMTAVPLSNEIKEVGTSANAIPLPSEVKEVVSVMMDNKSAENETKPIERSKIEVSENFTDTLSDSSDCLDLTMIRKEVELPLFLPLRIRDEVISQCLDSGSSVDELKKAFGYDKWAAYDPECKEDGTTSSNFTSLYNNILKNEPNNLPSNVTSFQSGLFGAEKPNLQLNANNNKESNLFCGAKGSNLFDGSKETSLLGGVKNSNLFGGGRETSLLGGVKSSNLFGGGKELTSNNIFANNITSNTYGTSKIPLGGVTNTFKETHEGSFGFDNRQQPTVSNNSANILATNVFKTQPTSFINQSNNTSQTNMNSNEQNQPGLLGRLPTPYDMKVNAKNDDDDDDWLGALSHTQPTPILPLGQNSFQPNNSIGGGSMMSTPYTQNSGSQLNFEAYNTNMKFNVNIASGPNQGESIKFGSDAIFFNNNNIPSSSSGGTNIMKSMLSSTNTQQTGNNSTSTGGNVFSNALKNFNFNAKFMQ